MATVESHRIGKAQLYPLANNALIAGTRILFLLARCNVRAIIFVDPKARASHLNFATLHRVCPFAFALIRPCADISLIHEAIKSDEKYLIPNQYNTPFVSLIDSKLNSLTASCFNGFVTCFGGAGPSGVAAAAGRM